MTLRSFIFFGILFTASLFGILSVGNARNLPDPYLEESLILFAIADTIPLEDRKGDFITDKKYNPFDITTGEIKQSVELDPATGNYNILEKIGDEYYRTPTYMTFEEYLDYKAKEQERDYFNNLAGIKSDKKSKSGRIDPMDKVDLKNSLIDRLFGGTEVNIQPQGTVDLSVGWLYSRRNDPNLPIQSQRQSQPDFPTPLIKMNVDGKIGKKLDLDFNYDTQSTFDFDRQIKLAFDSDAFSEDDIIKKIEAGNVSLPLRGNLIQGAQSLFGLKTELQFGRLRITGLASQQRSRSSSIQVQNGASVQEFIITPNEYDENRHFFLSHYNRNTYERNLSNIPYIGTPHQIAQLEVWVSDDRPEYQENSTMIAAIADLGEPDPQAFTSDPFYNPVNCQAKDDTGLCLPRNDANTIYKKILASKDIVDIDQVARQLTSPEFNLKRTQDFEVFRGRRLSASEYTFHPKLGTLSLNFRLRPNQVLGVAYNYYYTSNCDTLYQVGQLSASSVHPANQTDSTRVEPPKVFFTKLLKATNQATRSPMWDLMMKNVYNLRTQQLNQQDFEFDIFYEDDFTDGTLKKFLPEKELRKLPLLQFFNLDRLNRFGDPQPDGYFDYISGVTVIERSGSIVFPVLEPFGNHINKENLKNSLGLNDLAITDSLLIAKYRYQELYDTSISIAAQNLVKNKFRMVGKVKSTGNNGEINLGPFVPQGSVRVSAGGKQLVEGQDFEIDYSLGKLRIINDAFLAQGTPIDVRFEDNSLFSLQQKYMLGLRAEYQFNKKSSLGATYMRLWERPFTQKVNIGDDPINNRIFGLDYNYNDEAPWVTRLIDKLPFYSTREKSNINFTAEAAGILPGHSRAINTSFDDSGIANIDDFEGAITNLNLGGFNYNQWTLASTPPTIAGWDKENSLEYGANRAKINWYVLDLGTIRSSQDNTNPYTRTINQRELFTNRQVQPGQQQLFTFDISYYPTERGPYNFETQGGYPSISQGFRLQNGKMVLNDPKSRWGGIMRYFQNSDFEAANYESIEFWMLNPFMDRGDGSDPHPEGEEGELVFNLGSISEDIIKDNFLYFENALPTTQRKLPTTNTSFGRSTISIPLVNGFDTSAGASQDVGFDGLNNDGEQQRFQSWLQANNLAALDDIARDPANDDFVFFNDESLSNEPSLLNRLKRFNGPEGNAPLNNLNTNQFVRGNRYPDSEDLNNNKSLDQTEAYYEYKIRIKKMANSNQLDTTLANNFFVQSTIVTAPNGQKEIWYRFQVPILKGTPINGISGYRAIQFMRMYLTKFETPKTFRLAEFQLQRSQWRKQLPVCKIDAPATATFNLDDVGIEENSGKLPFNYISPKGVIRTQAFATVTNLLQDEKSMVMRFKNLEPTCEIAMTKLANVNLSLYKRLQMWIHAERAIDADSIKDGDLSIVVRLGKDFDNRGNAASSANGNNAVAALNFYEYELPITVSKEIGGQSQQTQENVWPADNYINIPLDSLIELKRFRIKNNIRVRDTIEMMLNPDKKDMLRIVGNPSLGLVKVIQIAIRNKSKEFTTHSGEVWVNELRVTGFDESGGVAAQARLQVQMADLGELNFSGNYSSIGFGALDKRLLERNRKETVQFDVAANVDAGKVLPKALKLSVPVYAQIQKTYITPRFDPFDQDIEVKDKLSLIQDSRARDSVSQQAREQVTVKTFNLTNVKTDVGGKGKPWSPSNVSLSYAFTETTKSDPIIREDRTTQRSVGLDYVYQRRSSYIEPFKFVKVKALKIISDFNFSLLPSNFSFTSRMVNQDNSRTFRLPSSPVFIFDDKRYRWERNYVLDWDLTKSLRFNFRANSMSIIDQIRQAGIADTADDRDWFDPQGNNVTQNVIDDPVYPTKYRNENIRNLGRSKAYSHNLTLNYKLPFKSIPILDWINAGADYKADYGWDGGSLITIDDIGTPLGNTIHNGQNASFNITFDFSKLYNKVGYLKAIETGKASRNRKRTSPVTREKDRVEKGDDKMKKTDDTSKKNEDLAGDAEKGKDGGRKAQKEDKPRDPTMAERVILRPLMLVRSVKVNLKDERSTLIPGFMEQSRLLGQNDGFTAPGWDFIAGVQPRLTGENNWLLRNQGWFNSSYNFNDALTQTKRLTADARLLVEPFRDFSVDVTMKRSYQESHTEVFRNKKMDGSDKFLQLARYDVGSFDASFFAMNTLFDNSFGLYNQFKENREIISRRLPNIENPGLHPADPGYVQGYGPSQNNVTVPAFIAAYTRQSAYNVDLDQQKVYSANNFIPRPNWQLNYSGLSKLKMFKNLFSNITIKHGYSSTIRVSNFQTQPNYTATDPFANISPNDNYYSRLEIPSVAIQEQFVPIIGISLRTVKDLKLDFEYKMTRNLELGITQLRENKTKEIVFGGGYVIKNFKGFGKKKKVRSKKAAGKDDQAGQPVAKPSTNKSSTSKTRDLRMNLSYSLRDDLSQVYDLMTGVDAQADRGSKTVTLNPTVEYDVNNNLTLRFYFDYSRIVPKTTLSFPVTTIRSGITFRFNIN